MQGVIFYLEKQMIKTPRSSSPFISLSSLSQVLKLEASFSFVLITPPELYRPDVVSSSSPLRVLALTHAKSLPHSPSLARMVATHSIKSVSSPPLSADSRTPPSPRTSQAQCRAVAAIHRPPSLHTLTNCTPKSDKNPASTLLLLLSPSSA